MVIRVLTALVAWGVFSFGAVYDWAIAPLAAGVLAVAVWQCRIDYRRVPWTVAVTVALLLAAISLQLVPVSAAALSGLSPAAARYLSSYDVGVASGVVNRHALSIDPSLTARTLGFVGLWIIWIATCASVLGRGLSIRLLARNIAIVGTAVALIGLAQKATFNGKLLWFWTPRYFATNGFGPFVNRNHFAGWMLLAFGMTLGLVLGYASRAGFHERQSWRERMLWLGSPAASTVWLTAAAAFVMACSLVWTMSRSGILAAGCAVLVLTAGAAWRSNSVVQRWLVVGCAVSLIVAVVTWRGADTLFGWYGNTATWQWRMQLWKDTVPVAREFWVTGSGLNTYGRLMLVMPHTDLTTDPVQAHNDYLQLAVEGGLLVGIPALLLMIAVGRQVARGLRASQDALGWWVRMGAVAGLCGMAVQEISEFSLQVPGVSLLCGIVLALAIHTPATASARQQQMRPRLPSTWRTGAAA